MRGRAAHQPAAMSAEGTLVTQIHDLAGGDGAPQLLLDVMPGLPLLGPLLGTDLATPTGFGHIRNLCFE